MVKAVWTQRYGWHLRNEDMKENSTCKKCGHECHCSNGGSCCGGQCQCGNCEHRDTSSYEANNA